MENSGPGRLKPEREMLVLHSLGWSPSYIQKASLESEQNQVYCTHKDVIEIYKWDKQRIQLVLFATKGKRDMELIAVKRSENNPIKVILKAHFL